MKGLSFLAAIVLLPAGGLPAAAQTAPAPAGSSSPVVQAAAPARRLVRADATALLGVYVAGRRHPGSRDRWLDDSASAAGSAGYYWTDHLKTAVEYNATGTVRFYTASVQVIQGIELFVPVHYRFSTRRMSIAQVYQFGRNEWFHPYLGGGLDVVWQHTEREDEPAFYFDPIGRDSRQLRDRVRHPGRTEVKARASAAAGFKGYLTRRAFFVLDGRLSLASPPDELMIRAGFGVDFQSPGP